ncbi:hypothetical protein C8Q74DRAFT_1276011 [Fomes fomentarius]|nr:hypothetical protein C8Q74DRAFT_1276011 [Fomes fomentarius]
MVVRVLASAGWAERARRMAVPSSPAPRRRMDLGIVGEEDMVLNRLFRSSESACVGLCMRARELPAGLKKREREVMEAETRNQAL